MNKSVRHDKLSCDYKQISLIRERYVYPIILTEISKEKEEKPSID